MNEAPHGDEPMPGDELRELLDADPAYAAFLDYLEAQRTEEREDADLNRYQD